MSDKKDLYKARFYELDDFKKCEDKFVEYLNLRESEYWGKTNGGW